MPVGQASVVSVGVVVLLLMLPARTAAQKNAFVDAFITFHSALPGTYGDEGPLVTAALDRLSAALDEWERASRISEERLKASATPADLALLYVDQQRLEEAIVATNGAIAADPRRAPLHVFQGLLLEASGRPGGTAFERARQLDASDPVAAYLVAARLSESGGGDPVPMLVNTLQAAIARGGLRQTEPFFPFALIDDGSANTPIFAPAAYAEGFASMVAGRFRQAIEQFRGAVKQDPLVVDPAGNSDRVRLGTAALRDGRGAAAVEHLEAAVAALPTSSEAHRVLGVVYRAVGRVSDSIRELEAAVRLAPGDERARLALGSVLVEAGSLNEAERVLLETIDVLPKSGNARWALAEVYEQVIRGPDAIPLLDEAASLTVVAGKTHLYWKVAELAHAYHRDSRRVIQALSRRARLVPNEPHPHKDLGLAYLRAGRDDEALVELLMSTLLGYEDAEMLGAIGQIHLNASRFEAAEIPLRRAVALDPNLAQARYAFGITLHRLGRGDESKEHLDAFHRLQSARFEAQRQKYVIDTTMADGDRHAQAGRLEEAVAAYEKAAALGAPPEVHRRLAGVYLKLGRVDDSARAQAMYDKRRAGQEGDGR
jgi:tetratricopeptide (TPR) repeat protein